MRKPQKSIRLTGESRKRLSREIVRLTLNPVLLAFSHRVVSWDGTHHPKRVKAADLVLRARERFPDLPLSWAVEGYLVLLLIRDTPELSPIQVEPFRDIPESVRRFSRLDPSEKIRIGERWKDELRRIRHAL